MKTINADRVVQIHDLVIYDDDDDDDVDDDLLDLIWILGYILAIWNIMHTRYSQKNLKEICHTV